jgi:KUP system potassium uptake protein
MLVPMLVLATMAAVIASQALISGVFSLTRQAIQLGFWPRLTVIHTSAEAEGQIYIPEMNYLLMIGCLVLVLQFRTSSALAAAYGIAVTGTMAITSILFYRVAVQRWQWPRTRAGRCSRCSWCSTSRSWWRARPRCSTAAGSRCRSASRCSRS